MLVAVKEKLEDSSFAGFSGGDSAGTKSQSKFDKFFSDFEAILQGSVPFTFILDDPLGNSFLFSPCAPEPEPRLVVEEYERTHEQNEEFGLNDMKTENYDDANDGENNVYGKEQSSSAAQSTMAGLQTTGKAAHPHEQLVGKPDLETGNDADCCR